MCGASAEKAEVCKLYEVERSMDFSVRTKPLPAAAAMAPGIIPVHKDATTTIRIFHPDFKVVCCAEDYLTDGKNTLVDVTVAGPNAQVSHRAQYMCGASAEKAEVCKLYEVERHWALNPNVGILPFAVEFSRI